MERELWKVVYTALKTVARRFHQKYVQLQPWRIAAVLLWAALHDRPVSWACRKRNWSKTRLKPGRLPSESTVSRRAKRTAFAIFLNRVADELKGSDPPAWTLVIDGKPLPVGRCSKDRDAKSGPHGKGYKLYWLSLIPYAVPQHRVAGGNPVARIEFVRHRSANQIRAKYRACRHTVEKVRWHAIWLLARADEPRAPSQVAGLVGLSDVTVRAVLHRWNAAGPDGLTDRRKGNGSEPKLTPRRRDALYAALQGRPPDGGVWTGPKVVKYVRDRWGVSAGPVTGWRWLRGLGFTLQVPRPSHPKAADRPTRRAWKKTCDGG